VVYEDIRHYKSELDFDLQDVERLLFRLAASDEINLDTLAQALEIKKEQAQNITNLLEKAELIITLNALGKIDKRLKKDYKKVFFMSPSIRKALLSFVYGIRLSEKYKGKLLEDLIVLYLKRILKTNSLSFVYAKKGKSCDFVLETLDKPILIEVGTKKKDASQIMATHINFRYGIVIAQNIKKLHLKEKVVFLPLLWFLML